MHPGIGTPWKAQAPLNSRVRLLTVWSYCFYRQGRTQDSHRILGPVHKRQFHTYWWKIPRGYVCQYNSNMSVSLISPPKLFVLQLDLVKIPYLSLLSALQQMPEVRHRRPWPGWVFCRVQHWALRSMTNTGLLLSQDMCPRRRSAHCTNQIYMSLYGVLCPEFTWQRPELASAAARWTRALTSALDRCLERTFQRCFYIITKCL